MLLRALYSTQDYGYVMEVILEADKELLLWLNGFHTPWLDPVMLVLTKTLTWLPVYLFLLYLVIKDYRKESWRVLLAIAITVVLTDQLTSSVMKPYFERLRPSRDPEVAGLLHLVNGYTGGVYGFASSHAANSFGVAMFLWLLYRNTRRWIWTVFLWALLFTYTRIYLGVHYPGDILAGALVGLGCAAAIFNLYKRLLDPHKTVGT